jgi:MinD-like ATPase involved in chromosome partitioning or flagellar assembly
VIDPTRRNRRGLIALTYLVIADPATRPPKVALSVGCPPIADSVGVMAMKAKSRVMRHNDAHSRSNTDISSRQFFRARTITQVHPSSVFKKSYSELAISRFVSAPEKDQDVANEPRHLKSLSALNADDWNADKKAKPPAVNAPAAHATWGPDVWPTEVRANLGEWPPKFRDRELISQIRTKFARPLHVAVISGKSGPGKTTLSRALSNIFSSYRTDKCVMLDASAERHSLGEAIKRVVGRHRAVVAPRVGSGDYAPVLAKVMEPYALVVTDLDAKADPKVRRAVLDAADCIIVVATPVVDSVFSASGLLEDLRQDGYRELADNAVVAINRIRRMPFSDLLNIDRHFAKQSKQVVRIPWDSRVGGEIDSHLDGVRPSTRTGLFELAAAVARRAGTTKRATAREKERVQT